MGLTITDNAIQEIKLIVEQQKFNINDIYILLGIKITQSGFSYNFHIVESVLDDSIIQIIDGVKFVLNKKFRAFFDDLKLDYILEPTRFGFVFDNPNIENVQ
jgi:Fe-S cluster assembly iron-binding protein IscA